MPRTKKTPTTVTSDTFAEKKAKFESKRINVGREHADHRRKLKTAVKKREGVKRRKTTKKRKAKKTTRKKR